MSKKVKPATLGLFIIVGLALAIGSIVLFSSRSVFHKSEKYILYFDASVKGLNPGAPVRFRGVTVGKVAEMLILHNQAAGDPDMPVIIEVDESVFRKKTDQTINLAASDDLDKWSFPSPATRDTGAARRLSPPRSAVRAAADTGIPRRLSDVRMASMAFSSLLRRVE